jgi:hypothetical protein
MRTKKRANALKVDKKRAEGGLDTGEALIGEVLVWPVAAGYRIAPGSVLAPEPGCEPHMGVRSFPPPSPSKDPELYLSFAKLAYGRKARERIQDWVSGHGLLTRRDPSKAGNVLLEGGVVNQAPMTLDDFTVHAAKFDTLLRLYAEVGSGNTEAIASRINRRASVLDERLASVHRATGSTRGILLTSLEYEVSYAKHPVLWIADKVLCDAVAEELKGVRIRPVSGFAISWQTTNKELAEIRSANPRPYVPTNSFTCPDLLSVLYFQLFLVISYRRPVCRCEGCGSPLPESARKDRRHHNTTCRSNARYKRERAAKVRISGS